MIGANVDIKDLIMFASHPRMALQNAINVVALGLKFLNCVSQKFKWSFFIRKLDYKSFYNNTGGAIYRVRLMTPPSLYIEVEVYQCKQTV